MMLRFIPLLTGLLVSSLCFAQQAVEKWDLQRSVDYALKNNISVRQADLQARITLLSLQQNKASQLPTLNFGSNAGYSFGRSENPTTGVLEDNNFFNLGVQLQSQVTIFNWFNIKNTIEASRLSLEADRQQIKKSTG